MKDRRQLKYVTRITNCKAEWYIKSIPGIIRFVITVNGKVIKYLHNINTCLLSMTYFLSVLGLIKLTQLSNFSLKMFTFNNKIPTGEILRCNKIKHALFHALWVMN